MARGSPSSTLNEAFLTPVDLARIKLSINGLIEELDDSEADRPAPAGTEPADPTATPPGDSAADMPVVTPAAGARCIAGGELLDEEASAILTQLLEQQGLASRIVPHAASSRRDRGVGRGRRGDGVHLLRVDDQHSVVFAVSDAAVARACRGMCRCWSGSGPRTKPFCTTNGCVRRWVRITTPAHCMRP
jgi:hypothetical protein